MWLTKEWHYWAKWMSNSSHRMLALLFITYFPTPITVFPSGLTSAALLKMQLPTGKFTGKEKQWLLTRGTITVNVKLVLHKPPLSYTALLRRGNIKRDESHYSFVLPRLRLSKTHGFMSYRESIGKVNGRKDMFQHFKIPHLNHRMLFIGVTGEGVCTVVTCAHKQNDPFGANQPRSYEIHLVYWKVKRWPIMKYCTEFPFQP